MDKTSFFPTASLLQARHKLHRRIREFFWERDFIEVCTPTIVPNPGLEPHLQYFETQYVPDMVAGAKQTLYLPTSPEYHLKKALASGVPRVFEIAKSFRNGEAGAQHEPEFSMLEWYRQSESYLDIAKDVEELFSFLADAFPESPNCSALKTVQHLNTKSLFQDVLDINLDHAISNPDWNVRSWIEMKISPSLHRDDSFETAFQKVMLERIETTFANDQITFLWDFPAPFAALSRLHIDRPIWCRRFEVYWGTIELANAFDELLDSQEQIQRCQIDQNKRQELYGKSPPVDLELIAALGRIQSPCGGIALGVDRLMQVILNTKRLQDSVPFPFFRDHLSFE